MHLRKEPTMNDLLEILNDLHPDVDFENEEHLIDNMILDSFDIVTLISEISDVYDVTISAEQIIPENFNSAKALYALIQELEEE
jgi:acyl carrier protein